MGLYTPHGYYLSEAVNCPENSMGIAVFYSSREPVSTGTNMYVRVRRPNEEFGDYCPARNGFYSEDGEIEQFQYAISLNTTNGKQTPEVYAVRTFAREQLIPEKEVGVRNTVFPVTVAAQSVTYYHYPIAKKDFSVTTVISVQAVIITQIEYTHGE